MSLNIKNERVHALAREAAAKTGKSQTSVIEEALRRYLDQLERERRDRDRELDTLLEEIHRIVRTLPPGMTTDDLYDPETGLPA